MVTISFSEPLTSAADLYAHIVIVDWSGCVPYRYVPTPETVQTLVFQCRATGSERSDGVERAAFRAGTRCGTVELPHSSAITPAARGRRVRAGDPHATSFAGRTSPWRWAGAVENGGARQQACLARVVCAQGA